MRTNGTDQPSDISTAPTDDFDFITAADLASFTTPNWDSGITHYSSWGDDLMLSSVDLSSNVPTYLSITDIIPFSDSGETAQNSEPSLAVDPLDPRLMIAGVFGSSTHPYFMSTNGGTAWSDYGTINHQDKSLAWLQDGSAALTATLLNDVISTYSGTIGGSNFGSAINTFNNGHSLDQPWIRTGPSNHVYVAYNDLFYAGPSKGGATAFVLVSANGGSTYTAVSVDRLASSTLQDAPSVRLAVNGNTVYAAFTHWTSVIDSTTGATRYTSQVVIVRSDNGGADNFTALGNAGNGVQVAAPTSYATDRGSVSLALGQERTDAELAIAVDPNNPNRVIVVYGAAPGASISTANTQLIVAESTNGGATWKTDYTLSASSTNYALPGLSILANGSVGLLYCDYNITPNTLDQHLLTTTDDFTTTSDVLLGTESNATPTSQFNPYIGDFFDLTSVGNNFCGIFCASNADNGTDAQLNSVTAFLRNHSGTPGMPGFQVTDGSGNPVTASIDPYVFSGQLVTGPPRPNDFNADGISDLLWRQTGGEFTTWSSTGVGFTPNIYANFVDPSWTLVGSMDFNGDRASDLVWRNTSTGTFTIWDATNSGLTTTGFTPNSYVDGSVSTVWTLAGLGDFNGDGKGDLIWQDGNVFTEWQSTGSGFTPNVFVGSVSSGWSLAGIGDFSGNGQDGLLWFNSSSNVFTIWDATGIGFDPNSFAGSVSSGWTLAGIGDFTGNRKDDLLWFNSSSNVFSIWASTGAGFTPNSFVGSVSPGWTLAGIGDYNGSGRDDLLWFNSGTYSIWQSNVSDTPSFTPNAQVGSVALGFTLVDNPTQRLPG
jgi:hypothetical protein